ncbi:zf-DHHC-domain-containing protein [Coprinopsis marcescibilis]|uniref:Palmitoyltransferase n=1 Tax=Coprinopsis marcescibilis TaxID=230819 RepID=A0A5C3L7Y6_COPMA|nr:zf-DHHC-domain-containing protein [Coprinopsis marcescibilis]
MPTRRTIPLINEHELQPRNGTPGHSISLSDLPPPEKPKKPWYYRLPLVGTIGFILAPQPSILWVLVHHHLQTLKKTHIFLIHLVVIYTLNLMIMASLYVCVTRDPGPVTLEPNQQEDYAGDDDEDVGLTEALMSGGGEDDFMKPGRWCRTCWAPKPERAHHCSVCDRCVLKMDHHCPWLGATCIGHRTYPAFVHFLTCITILAIYITTICVNAVIWSFRNPFEVINPVTPIHEFAVVVYGGMFAVVIGPFAAYHYYLISTNQTTLENISPFMLLRHLPPLPRSGHGLSDPPLEPELSYHQRRAVKDAHGKVYMYDVGWKKNWAQVFGWDTRRGWIERILYGGASPGDGRYFPRNPRSEAMLANLASELVKLDRNA